MIASRYEPTGDKNAGGMGDVITCIDRHLQRKVLIKRLQSGVEKRRLMDEQKALIKLRSKHVVQLYDLVKIENSGAIEDGLVLEFIEGKDLEVESHTPNHAYVQTLWQIASGLADIHKAGVIHRDIKPNNIRVDTEGVVKIFDFGLARSHVEAKTRSIIGTPIFMAPELWRYQTISFDYAIDVYAFGITALVLVTSKVPNELRMQPPQAAPWAAVAACLPGLSPDIVALLHKCIDVTPTNRPSMDEIQDLLARHLLKDEHRALVVMSGQRHNLNKTNRKISVRAGVVGSLTIEYDGFDFRITAASGAVTLNNVAAQPGNLVPGCCVITFGEGRGRSFVTFDVSSPEVMP